MPHGDAIVDGNRIKLCGITAQALNLLLHYLSYLMQVGVPRHKLCE